MLFLPLPFASVKIRMQDAPMGRAAPKPLSRWRMPRPTKGVMPIGQGGGRVIAHVGHGPPDQSMAGEAHDDLRVGQRLQFP